MEKKLKILHLASFVGNIGDNASHAGFDEILANFFSKKPEITKLDIRKFYKNYSLSDKLVFDDNFISLANKHNLLVIGGGAFLSFLEKDSSTGTVLNINSEMLKKINVPILVTSIGCVYDNSKKIPDYNINNFKNFIDSLLNREKTILALRNDGSKNIIAEHYGKIYEKKIPEVLDSGFFYDPNKDFYIALPEKYVLINIANDQVVMNGINSKKYYDGLNEVVKHIIKNTELDIVFAPHIYSDINAISKVFESINDYYVRTRVHVAPYSLGPKGADLIFSIYKKSELVLGMRFHSNICSLGMNVLSIGIAALDGVKNIYNSLGLPDRYVLLEENFSGKLIEKIDHTLKNKTKILEKSKKECELAKEETLKKYEKFFERLELI